MKILSIDPGNIESAYCVIDTETLRPLQFGKIENTSLLCVICDCITNYKINHLAIEMVASYRNGSRRDSF